MEWKGLSMSILAVTTISFVAVAVQFTCIPQLFRADTANYLAVSATYLGLVLLAMVCYFRTMFSDPGSTERCLIEDEKLQQRRLERLKEQGFSVCDACKSFKPERTHHCSQCARCIYKMDHHCRWVNNCIGAYNQKYFVLFLFYITAASVYSLFLSALSLIEMEDTKQVATAAAVLAAAAGFGGFTFQLLTEQGYYIWTNTSIIDILQGRETPQVRCTQRPVLENLQEVLGASPLVWLCPVAVPRQQGELTEPLLSVESKST